MSKLSKMKQITYASLATFAFLGVLAGIKYSQISKAMAANASFAPPPEAVTTIVAKEEVWTETLNAVGTFNSNQGVTLSAEEPGTVVNIAFESGQPVAEGDLLIELDTSVEEAKLRGAIAQKERAEKALHRYQEARATNAVSQDIVDNAIALALTADAEVRSLKAQIARKRLVAPFSGRVGIRLANKGQYVSAGTPLVPLYSLNPLFVDFSVPQRSISQLRTGQPVRLTVDAYPGREFLGEVTAINPQVDPSTRNVGVRGRLENKEEKLLPGMFAKVEVELPHSEKLVTIPSSSINYAPYGDTVFVVTKMKSPKGDEYLGVRQQVVKLGAKRGEQVSVLSGINPGEEVVTSGAFKLRPGIAVQINNSVQPGASADPRPANS